MEEVTTATNNNNNNINRKKDSAIWRAYEETMRNSLKEAERMWRGNLDRGTAEEEAK